MRLACLILLFACLWSVPASAATLFASYQIQYSKTANGDGTNTIELTVTNGLGTQTLGTKTLSNVPDTYSLDKLLERLLVELKSRALHNATVADTQASGSFTVNLIDLVLIPDVIGD